MNLETLFTIQEESGLNVSEFTSVMPIDRTTWYGWKNGKTPDPLRLRLALARGQRIGLLTDEGLLPFSSDVPKADRRAELVKLLSLK